jgi:hypothetical protein
MSMTIFECRFSLPHSSKDLNRPYINLLTLIPATDKPGYPKAKKCVLNWTNLNKVYIIIPKYIETWHASCILILSFSLVIDGRLHYLQCLTTSRHNLNLWQAAPDRQGNILPVKTNIGADDHSSARRLTGMQLIATRCAELNRLGYGLLKINGK